MSSLRSRHVAHFSSVHRPGDTRIFLKECRSLAKAGYSVEFIVPNGTGQNIDGVFEHGPKRPEGRLERFFLTMPQVVWRAFKSKAKYCHFHDPELIPAGILLRLLGRTVIYDVHEDLPQDVLTKAWIPKPIRKVVAVCCTFLEAVAGQTLSAIITATPSIAKRFPKGKTVAVCNYPILGELESIDDRPFPKRANQIAYVGGISKIRGIKEMLDAAKIAGGEHGIRLALAGPYESASLESQARQAMAAGNVDVLGTLPREDVRSLLSNSRAGIVVFHPGPNHDTALPNKLFEYMAAGVPVIASDFPLWADLIREADCGIVVSPLDPQSIAKAMVALAASPETGEQLGRNGAQAVRTRFNWKEEEKKLIAEYQRLGQ